MTTIMKRKLLSNLERDARIYEKAEAKLKQSIIAARSIDLSGKPACTLSEIADVIGITRQSVWEYINRWSGR